MLQSSDNSLNQKSGFPASNPNSYNPAKNVTAPVDQATIGRTLVIKGEISGSEALYIDGRIEGKITMPESRVTIGRNGKVDASIQAREVVVMGKVTGKSVTNQTEPLPPYKICNEKLRREIISLPPFRKLQR